MHLVTNLYEDVKHGSLGFPMGIYRTQEPMGFRLYPHIHEEFEFLVFTQGRGRMWIDGTEYPLSAGEGVFVHSRSIHLGQPEGETPSAYYAIVFSPRMLGAYVGDTVIDRYVDPVLRGAVRLPVRYSPQVPWQREALAAAGEVEALERGNAPCKELLLKAGLFRLWAAFSAHGQATGTQGVGRLDEIRETLEYIDREYAAPLTLCELAQRVHMSESHFSRCFSSVTHMSPFAYIQQVRIQKSCRALRDQELPVSRVALSCGFNDFSYYSKRFREVMGCTPSEYRRRCREETA